MRPAPKDILNHILEQNAETDFLLSLAKHVGNYSIGELTDRAFVQEDDSFYLVSKSYGIRVKIQDDDVVTALINGMYVSAFLSRRDDSYQVHFLVHRYPAEMKSAFDDNITQEVIRYMMLRAIIALRLDSVEKADDYIGGTYQKEG